MFITLYITISLLSLFKGPIIIELLLLMTAYVHYQKKIKTSWIVILIVVFLVIFPVISILRTNTFGVTYINISLSNVIEFYKENNPIKYVLQRFQYYDETYYTLSVNSDIMNNFRTESGNVIGRLFSAIIPRAIWKNKPIVNSSASVTYILCGLPKNIITSLTVGLIGECFATGSWGLVIIFGVFLGRLQKYIDSLIEGETSNYSFAVYLLIGTILIEFSEGDIIAKMVSLIMVWFTTVIVRFIMKRWH